MAAADFTFKAWVDDERQPPDVTWTWFRTAPEMIDILEGGILHHLTDISLDHDLGPPEAGTGYDVICCLERLIASGAVPYHGDLTISIHTANPSARVRMQLALDSINRLRKSDEIDVTWEEPAHLKWRAGCFEGPSRPVTYEVNVRSDGSVELLLIDDDFQTGWRRIVLDDRQTFRRLLDALGGHP